MAAITAAAPASRATKVGSQSTTFPPSRNTSARFVAGAFVVESSNQKLLDADARQGPLEAARYRELVDGTRTANRLALSGGIAVGLGAAAVAGWSLLEPSGRSPAPEWPESAGASK